MFSLERLKAKFLVPPSHAVGLIVVASRGRGNSIPYPYTHLYAKNLIILLSLEAFKKVSDSGEWWVVSGGWCVIGGEWWVVSGGA